jgi:hypothetical protein
MNSKIGVWQGSGVDFYVQNERLLQTGKAQGKIKNQFLSSFVYQTY